MKKKFILLSIAAAMLLSGAAQAQPIDSATSNIVISGTVPYDSVGDGLVKILIRDGSDITYADEAEIKDGSYFKKFKYTGDVSNCSVAVKAGAKDITADVLTAEAHTGKFCGSIEVIGSGSNRSFNEGDTVKLRAKLKNIWADKTAYKLIAASYGADGKLLDVKTFTKNAGYGEDGAEQTAETDEFTVPAGTAEVKGFVWGDNVLPLIKNSAQQTGSTEFRDGDRVAFIGDSITHIGIYTDFIEHYYQTKNPNGDYYFYNKGISGQEAANVLSRLDSDIFPYDVNRAVIMMGVNDLSGAFKNAVTEEDKTKAVERSAGYFEQVVKKCKEQGVELSIISPLMYDEDSSLSGEKISGLNDGLKQLTQKLKAIAETENIPFYDANTSENSIVDGLREKGVTGEIITSNDRTHPTRTGDTILAYCILKSQGVDGIVAKTEIDASNSGVKTENANVSALSITAGGGSFMYSPKSVPLAYNDRYQSAEKFVPDFTDTLNNEIISVKNLDEGSYDVALDGNKIGTYSAAELSHGINIATLSQNPNQAKAMENYKLLADKSAQTAKLRAIALAESAGAAPDDYSTEDRLEKFKARFAKHVYKGYILQYPDSKPRENDIKRNVEELREEAKQAVQPTKYIISVTKN